MPLQICFSTFDIPHQHAGHAAWGIPRSTCSSFCSNADVNHVWIISWIKIWKNTYLSSDISWRNIQLCIWKFNQQIQVQLLRLDASLGAVYIQMETRWTSWAPWLSNWVGWCMMFYDVYMVNMMVIICLMMVNNMLIVVTDFGYKESDSCARKLSLSVSAHEPLKHLKRSKECLLHSKGTTIYNILRAMLCQEIGPAQGTEQIPSECLWTWLCKGCNSKSLTNDDKRLRYVEKLEVIAVQWKSPVIEAITNSLTNYLNIFWICWSPFPSFQTFSICSLRIFSWLVWPLASALYLSPIDTLAIGPMCEMWIH